MADSCPTCGQAVELHTGSGGTSSYVKTAEEERASLQAQKDALTKVGDTLQSEASRVATWVQDHSMPYEVAMAAAGVLSAVEEWIVARTAPASEEAAGG